MAGDPAGGAPDVPRFGRVGSLSFDNDVVWEFDIPKVNEKTREGVVREQGRAT